MKKSSIYYSFSISFILSFALCFSMIFLNLKRWEKTEDFKQINKQVKDQIETLTKMIDNAFEDRSRPPEEIKNEFARLTEKIKNENHQKFIMAKTIWYKENVIIIYATSFFPLLIYFFLTILILKLFFNKKYSTRDVMTYCFRNITFIIFSIVFIGIYCLYVITQWHSWLLLNSIY